MNVFFAGAILAFAGSPSDWQEYTDKVLHVTFRYPKEWKPSPAYSDVTYFRGVGGSVQLDASEGNNALGVCHSMATHHLRPFGSHPWIRSIKVRGQKACLIWPSEEQGAAADAGLVVEFPRPVVIDGISYSQLIVYSDKNHILQIMKSLRFISQSSAR